MTTAVQNDVREQAAQRFAQLGWPTPELEEWRFTNIAPIERIEWREDDGTRPEKKTIAASLRQHAVAELVFSARSAWNTSPRPAESLVKSRRIG